MSKVDDIRKKYSGINARTFNSLNAADTTPTKKYLDYMCYLSSTLKISTKIIKDVVKKFDSLLPYIKNKDIYSEQYKDFAVLTTIIREAEDIKFEKSFIKEDNVTEIYKDENLFVLHIKTEAGSIKYGSGTRWCISGKNNNLFNSYNNSHYIYFIISKKTKFVILIDKSDPLYGEFDFYNEKDTNISPSAVSKNLFYLDENLFNLINTIRKHANAVSKIDKVETKIKTINNKFIEIIGICDNDIATFKSMGYSLTDFVDKKLLTDVTDTIGNLKERLDLFEKEMGG